MQLTTPVQLPPEAISLNPHDKIMMIGSCFAEHVGENLSHSLPEGDIDVNPFGVLYNPVSIANALRLLADGTYDDRHLFRGRDGIWHSWLHTSHFSAMTAEECREKIKNRLVNARDLLRTARLLCVTFGTTRCYSLADGTVVANCHKEPQSTFDECEASLSELADMWRETITMLRDFNPSLHICFTVSPYRYRKYGFHESQLQKAKLLLLVDGLMMNNPETSYFPAYEILLDELRDYRFYAADMLHPSDVAVGEITSRFKQWTFSPELSANAEEQLKEWRRSQHRTIM